MTSKKAQEDEGDRRDEYLIDKLELMRENVKDFLYAKYVFEIQLDKLKIPEKEAGSTRSGELLYDKLKESKENFESLQTMKAIADDRE